MTGSCRSAVLTAPGQIDVREFDRPAIGETDVFVSVDATGVCGTDVKVYKGLFREAVLPAILGHEVVGTVEEIGATAQQRFGVSPGDRIVVDPLRRCGDCEHCVNGEYQFCNRLQGPNNAGVHGYISTDVPPSLWGGYSEFMYLDKHSILYPIDPDLPSTVASLAVATVGNSVGWLRRINASVFQQSLIIQGPGPQGLSMTAVAKQMGFSTITVIGVPGDEPRLDAATEMGADETICAQPEDLVTRTKARVGTGDVVVNLTGTPSSLQQTIELVSENGEIVNASLSGNQRGSVGFDEFVRKNATMHGVLSRNHDDTVKAIRLISERPGVFGELISHKYPLSETDEALRCAAGMLEDATPLKVCVRP